MSIYGHSFTFDGVDVEDLGLYYAPDVKGNDTYVWHPATPKILEQSFDARDGGLYYGRVLGAKEFTLRCFYEQNPNEEGVLNNVYRHFELGKRGKLSFELRPWLYYNVVITNIDINTMYNFQNGLVTITCKAYKPYAISNIKYNTYDKTSYDYTIVHNNSNMWDSGGLTYPSGYNSCTYSSSGSYFYVYNGGNCKVKPLLTYKYVCDNIVRLSNTDNGTSCILESSNLSGTTSTITINVNCEKGKVTNANGELAFQYHRSGFIELEPDRYVKDITLTADNTYIVKANRNFTDEEKAWLSAGRAYAYNGGKWAAVTNVYDASVKVSETIKGTVILATFNKMLIKTVSGATGHGSVQFTYDFKFE